MRSPYCFIATPVKGVRYSVEDEKSKFIKSASQEDHRHTNRLALVSAIPLNYEGPIQVGDTIVVHHNVFRKYYDIKGKEQHGPCYFKDNIYVIEPNEVYLYKTDMEHCQKEWTALDPYCFLKPLNKVRQDLLSLKTEEKEIGELVFLNTELTKLGLNKGDVVSFLPDSEYEFNINGEKLYRMRTRNITVKLAKWTQEN